MANFVSQPEINTLVHHSDFASEQLSGFPMYVSEDLRRKGIFNNVAQTLLEMKNADTPTAKATILVASVRKEIEITPEKFDKFVSALHSQHSWTGGAEVAMRLESELLL